MEEDKVYLLLKWLYESDLFIHYSNANNLYFALVDIIDSIDTFENYNVSVFYLKDILYDLVRKNYKDFYNLMLKYDYPNILQKDIIHFCNRILAYALKMEKSPYLEILIGGLKQAKKQKELLFLSGNKEKEVIEDYFGFYLQRIATFINAKHIFDNEENIKESLKKYNFCNGNTQLSNYTFVDSISNPLIQISDCVVGFLGKFFTYINSIDILEAQQLPQKLNEQQLKTLGLFSKLITKSEKLSKILFCSIQPIKNYDLVRDLLLNVEMTNPKDTK